MIRLDVAKSCQQFKGSEKLRFTMPTTQRIISGEKQLKNSSINN